MINIKYTGEEIDAKRDEVRKLFFEKSKHTKSADLERLYTLDLWILYALYDEIFLRGFFANNFKGILKFAFSAQLTSSAGITKCAKNLFKLTPEEYKFEIKMSAKFIFDYYKTDREKKVNGYSSTDPLDAMMLVFEHELCHVIEYLITQKSSCKKQAFKQMAFNIFGHTDVVHDLPSNHEINHIVYGFKVGDGVSFEFEGKMLCGMIYRINKRAVVMVEHKSGKYTDKTGKRYNKYYVLLDILKKA